MARKLPRIVRSLKPWHGITVKTKHRQVVTDYEVMQGNTNAIFQELMEDILTGLEEWKTTSGRYACHIKKLGKL